MFSLDVCQLTSLQERVEQLTNSLSTVRDENSQLQQKVEMLTTENSAIEDRKKQVAFVAACYCEIVHHIFRCIGGSNSTRREFVCGYGSCLSTKSTKQHRHRPKGTEISNMSSVRHTDPGVFQIALFKGFPNSPKYPPLRNTQWAEFKQQRHQPLKIHRAGTATSPRDM